MVKNRKAITIFAKALILDVQQGSEYASKLASKCKLKMFSFLNQFEYEINRQSIKKKQKERTKRTY